MVLRDAQLAVKYGQAVNGIWGPSPLLNLPHFNVVWGYCIDYMHCVLLGVTRQLMEALLSPSNSKSKFYVGKSCWQFPNNSLFFY